MAKLELFLNEKLIQTNNGIIKSECIVFHKLVYNTIDYFLRIDKDEEIIVIDFKNSMLNIFINSAKKDVKIPFETVEKNINCTIHEYKYIIDKSSDEQYHLKIYF